MSQLQQPYPRPGQEGAPERTGWRRWAALTLSVVLIVGALAALSGAVIGALTTFDPLGEEWECADDEAPAFGPRGGSDCYLLDRPLPAGARWDPLGNRPLPSDCSGDRWTLIERDDGNGQDCLDRGLRMPAGWHRAD